MEAQTLAYCLTHSRHSINAFLHLCMLGLYVLVCEIFGATALSLGPTLEPDKAQPGNEGSSCHAFSFPSSHLSAFTKAAHCPSSLFFIPTSVVARLTLDRTCDLSRYSLLQTAFAEPRMDPRTLPPNSTPDLCFL